MNEIVEQPAPEAPVIHPFVLASVIRLADEGLPVRAIARSLCIPSSDLYEILRDALEAGSIVEIPKDDWPAGTPRAQRALYAGTILENPEQLQLLCVRLFKATRQQAAVLSTMLRRTELTKGQIHTILQENRPRPGGGPTDEKMVDVVMFHIRKKLKPYHITIETIWGTGYLITPAGRAAAIKLLEEFQASLLDQGEAA